VRGDPMRCQLNFKGIGAIARSVTRSLFGTILLVAVSATAEPPSVPPPQVQTAPYGAPITLELAKKAAAAAEKEALRAGENGAAIAVVQPNGELVYFEKLDDSTYVAIEFAQSKARTAAVTRHATGGWGPNATYPSPDPKLTTLPGGLPIVIGGRTVGAIGVSGVHARGTDDVTVAAAGLKAIE
jgi:glc operon protein GlcG